MAHARRPPALVWSRVMPSLRNVLLFLLLLSACLALAAFMASIDPGIKAELP
jgi:hypothetical protein